MAVLPKNVARLNDPYRIVDLDVLNSTGADLAVGDLAVLDWTEPGTTNSLKAMGTDPLLLDRYRKCVVLPQSAPTGAPQTVSNATVVPAIKNGEYGRVRCQGPVYMRANTASAFAMGDPIAGSVGTGATSPGYAAAITASKLGLQRTDSTYIRRAVASCLTANGSAGSTTPADSHGLVYAMFDGSDCMALYVGT